MPEVVTGLSLICPSLDPLVTHAMSVEKILTHSSIVYETRSQSIPLTAVLDRQPPPLNETKTQPSDSPRMPLDCYQWSTFAAPQAAICWSANLQPQIKSSFKMGSLIGRRSGESFQLAFHSPGFVVVQPSEGQPVVASS